MDTATIPCTTHSKCRKFDKKIAITTTFKTRKTTPKSCSSTVKSSVTTPKSRSTKSKSHLTNAKTTIKNDVGKNKLLYDKISNKPYVRPLRTAYLDKRSTTMPKCRKETRALEPFHARPGTLEAASATPAIQMQGIKRQWAHREKQTSAPSTTLKVTRKCNFNKKLDKTKVIKKQQLCKVKDITTAPPATTVKVTKNLQNKRKLCVGKKVGVPLACVTTTEKAEKVTKNLKMTNHLRKVRATKSLHVSKEKCISTPLTTNPVTATEILTESPKVKDELKKTKRAVQKQIVKTSTKKTSSVDTKSNTATVPLTTESKSKKCTAQNTKTITPTSSTDPPTSLNAPKTQIALPQTPTTPLTTPTATVKSPITTPNTPKTPSISPIKKEELPSSFYGMIGNKPYIRPPPTSYLDESCTTMQKRRKEISWTPHQSSAHPDPVEAVFAIQRQRCTKCFLPFNSAKELQTHLSLKKCTTLFGFDDSDEEGNR
ncbi:hypothetical protein UPYG_G00016210 [Umbra pygmaea]|uniref:Uncharacterized protein n=1 Tax=Umbra pygmaea TaxID=75934 RepID=A0ABD0XJP6_UMBPY